MESRRSGSLSPTNSLPSPVTEKTGPKVRRLIRCTIKMVAPILKSIAYRGLLPAGLLFAAGIRPSFISLGYLIFALIGPILPSTNSNAPLPASIRSYVYFAFVFAVCASIGQLGYQIYEPTQQDEDEYTRSCSTSQFSKWMRQIGFIRFHAGAQFDSARSFLPEVVALVTSLLTLIIVQCLGHQSFVDAPASVMEVRNESGTSRISKSRAAQAFTTALKRVSNAAVVILVAAVGCMQPSVLNALYFFSFLVVTSWWSTYISLRHTNYNKIKAGLIAYSGLHFIAIFVYQIPEVTSLLPEKYFLARLLGFSSILVTNCDKWYAIWINPELTWNQLANPLMILVLYYTLVLQLIWTKHGSRGYIDDDDAGSSVHEETRFGTQTTYLEGSSSNVGSPTVTDLVTRPRGHTMLLGNEDDEVTENLPMRKITSQVIDKQKISQIFHVFGVSGAPGSPRNLTAQGVIAILAFSLEHAYVFGLLAMMTWALLYHSVFGLIYLLVSCVIWMFKDTKKASYGFSPLILVYTKALLIIQYVYSMDINLPTEDFMQILGFIINKGEQRFIVSMIKVLLSLPIFLLFRLRQREAHYNKLSEHERLRKLNYGTFANSANGIANYLPPPNQSTACLDKLTHILTKYWIILVSIVLLLASVQTPPALLFIGFYVIWSLGVIYFKVSFRFFRGISYVFWSGLVCYTSIVICILYIYQFKNFPNLWNHWTGLDDVWNADIGLVNYSVKKNPIELINRLGTPIALFVVAMLQLKFFHEPWTKLVQPVRAAIDAEAGHSGEDIAFSTKVTRWLNTLSELLWRVAEVHVSKIVFIVIMAYTASNITAVYVPVVTLISIALCIPSRFSSLFALIICSYLCLVAFGKMVFQLHVVDENIFGNNTDIGRYIFGNGSSDCNRTVPLTKWMGFEKLAKGTSILGQLEGLLLTICVLIAQSVVYYRQHHARSVSGENSSQKSRIFPELDPITYDHNLLNCFKYFVDFGFYKFGLECCLVMMAINAWTRMDMLGTVSIIWLGIFSLSKRSISRSVWPLFVIYLALLLPIQYAIYVGIPPSLCLEYPWSNWLVPEHKNTNMLIWLGLTDYNIEWRPNNLIADFFLLLLVSCQAVVFRAESSNTNNLILNNESIYLDGKYTFKENPKYDFVSTQKSFVDFFKIAVFMYGHWVTLIMVLVAGLGGTSLFALGYICLSFLTLWSGNNLYMMKDHQKTIKRWRVLLAYTVSVMFCKVALQVVGCVFLKPLSEHHLCILRQLFSIICVNNMVTTQGGTSELFDGANDFDNQCSVQGSETRIGFDLTALIFIVLQLRILHSWYFQHCMLDFRAEIILANRGAVLANQLIEKEMKEQTEQQEGKFAEIKKRTDAIRAIYDQQQQLGKTFEPQTYGQAKRAGDYYMFDYDPATDQLVKPIESFVPEVDPEGAKFDKLDPTQLIHTAVNKDLDVAAAMKQVEKAEKIKGDHERQMIAAVTDDESPGTSGESDDELREQREEDGENKVVSLFRFGFKMICNFLDWMSVGLTRTCREHRYVAYVLGIEKAKLKSRHESSLTDNTKKLTEVRENLNFGELQVVQSERDIEKLEHEVNDSWQRRNVLARLLNALGHCISAHTDVICYLLAFVTHAWCSGLISMPLPLMVFFWGTLSNPRPSKFFWIAMIGYTEFIIVVKFVFQFGFMPSNAIDEISKNANKPYAWNKVLGLEKRNYFAFLDVALLIMLFFHRYTLRKLGLWKDATVSDTFREEEQAVAENSPASAETTEEDDLDAPAEPPAENRKNPIVKFIYQLFHPKFRYIKDLYPYMFAIDIWCFLLIAFGYSSFGEGGSGSVVSDIQSNKIPFTFVLMLVSLTLMIVIDRGLYLRKAVYCKLAYQFAIVVFMHIWIFLVLPSITQQDAKANYTALTLYVFKCIYLLISAWQIRNGYSSLCIGNLLTHAYGLSNMIFFKIFMAVPFIFELRTAIDWTWTDTSMPLFDFFNMENFYATIYNLKCGRTFEARYPAPRGVAKGVVVKYFMGIPMILLIVLIIWCPLIAFSLLNTIGTKLTPTHAELTISVEGYPPLYRIEAQGNELRNLKAKDLRDITDGFSKRFNVSDSTSVQDSRLATSFIQDYNPEDTLVSLFRPESESFWDISTDSLVAMKYALANDTNDMKMIIHLTFTRPRIDDTKEPVSHTSENEVVMKFNDSRRQMLSRAISGESDVEVEIDSAFPAYLIIPNEGELKPADRLIKVMSVKGDLKNVWAKLKLKLAITNDTMMWTTQMNVDPTLKNVTLPLEPVKYGVNRNLKYVQVVSLVDRVFPTFFAKYVQGGIIAMYFALVVLIGKVLRSLVTNSPMDVMISEIPNPDYLLKICLDIYLVREAKDFVLEQDLFAKLIFLFRSPTTLIKWTRYKVKDE